MTHEVQLPISGQPENIEIINSPENSERYELVNAGAIAIFGEEGAGKSNLAEALSITLNARLLEGGKTMREKAGGNKATIGFLERPLSVDQNFDQDQHDKMILATPTDPLVNESRLSGFIATNVMNENPDLKILRINVTAPARIRMSRIRKRAIEAWEDEKDNLLGQYLKGLVSEDEFEKLGQDLVNRKKQFTIGKIRREETSRRRRDIKQWTQAWPQLECKDPLNPGTVINGQKLYDLTISTGKRSKKETLDTVITWLLENGHIRKAEPNIDDQISPSDYGSRN